MPMLHDENDGEQGLCFHKTCEVTTENQSFTQSHCSHTEEDKDLIIISKEIDPHQRSSTYGKPFRIATSVKGKPPDNLLILLNKLTTDQVRVFGRNMGVPGCFSKSKFLCCVAIANHFDFHNRLGKYGFSPTT